MLSGGCTLTKTNNNHKKIVIIIICTFILIVAGAITVFVIVPKIHSAQDAKIEKYMNEDLEITGGITIGCHATENSKAVNTVSGIKEAVRLNADVVSVDICFNKSSEPVLCDDYDNAENSPKAEEAFKLLNKNKYKKIKLNLNIVQLSSLKALNALIAKYNLADRIIISGIDEEHYSVISGKETPAKLYFDYSPDKSMDAKTLSEDISSFCNKYSVSGIMIPLEAVNKTVIKALQYCNIPYFIKKVNSKSDMCRVMSFGASYIETDSPEELSDLYNTWVRKTAERYESSVVKSLADLSTTKKQ